MGRTATHVIQLFRSYRRYGKEEFRSGSRARIPEWPDRLTSTSGFVEGETLVVNETVRPWNEEIDRARLIVLIDRDPLESHRLETLWGPLQNEQCAILGRGEQVMSFELFQIREREDHFDVALDYSSHASHIGRPSRDDFKIGELRSSRPLRVTINGKSDSTASSGQARAYKIYDYLFVYLGLCTEYRIAPLNRIRREKAVPVTKAKHVDLSKVLY